MDVFTLKTNRGAGHADQGTGALRAWNDLTGWQRASETNYMLHTGRRRSPVPIPSELKMIESRAHAVVYHRFRSCGFGRFGIENRT